MYYCSTCGERLHTGNWCKTYLEQKKLECKNCYFIRNTPQKTLKIHSNNQKKIKQGMHPRQPVKKGCMFAEDKIYKTVMKKFGGMVESK